MLFSIPKTPTKPLIAVTTIPIGLDFQAAFNKFVAAVKAPVAPVAATFPAVLVASAAVFKLVAVVAIAVPLATSISALAVLVNPFVNVKILFKAKAVTIALTAPTTKLLFFINHSKVCIKGFNSGISFFSFGKTSFTILLINFLIPSTETLILGTIFFAAVTALSTNLSTDLLKSWLSSAIAVNKLLQAAFIEFTEPEIVDAASFEVVPVIPMFSCTL